MRLRRVQQRHLRAILRVPYTDRITNDQILDRAGVPDIEMIVRKMQLRWAGHVARMSDDRIPKQLLFGELTIGTRTVGLTLLRCKDTLNQTSPQRTGKTPQLIVAHGGNQFMTDSCYTMTLGEREEFHQASSSSCSS